MTDYITIKRILNSYFCSKPVERVWLFGSYARDEQTADSDIDLLVQVDESKRVGLDYFLWPMELSELFQRRVDLVTEKYLSRRIRPFVDRDKTLVYEK